MDATLPLVFCGGFPKSLYELNETELERFLMYVWTFTNTAKHARVLPIEENKDFDRAQALRHLICAVYERLGLSYLLYFSEGLAKTKGCNIYYEIDAKKNVIIVWNKRSKTIIARIPASNVCYDAFSGKLETPKKKTRRRPISRKKVWSQVPIVHIELPDSDTEDPLYNTGEKVEEESIVISDSEEPTKNHKKELCTCVPFISNSVSVTKLPQKFQPKNNKDVPFINRRAISITKVIPNAEVSLIDDDDDDDEVKIVISDSEDTIDQDLLLQKVPDRSEEEIVISDSEDAIDLENKSNFLYRLGLCEPTNLPDDPIILPIPGKGDFNKFHRLPLMMIPLLVRHSLIDKQSVVPGPPGQNSQFTSTNNIYVSENINKSYRTLKKLGRHKTVDINNCMDYKYPKKHFRGALSAPLPLKKRRRKLPPAKKYSYSKKKKKRWKRKRP